MSWNRQWKKIEKNAIMKNSEEGIFVKEKMKKAFKKSRRFFVEYVSTNRLFISFVILSLIGTIIVRGVTVGNAFSFQAIIVDFALILIIGSFGYLVKPKNQFRYFLLWLIIFTLMEVINSIYYTFYMTFASFGMIASISQVGSVADSLVARLRLVDFIYVIFPIFFYYIHRILNRTTYYNMVSKVERSKKMCVGTLLVGVVFLAFTLVSLTGTDYSRLSKQWNREYNVKRFGIILYQGNDLVQSLTPSINSMFGYDEAARQFRDFYAKQDEEEHKDNKYTDILKGKNIVFVHMESFQSFPLNKKINGKEVTPNINKLMKESLYFSNFYAQISVGTSSDTEFTLNSSLLPVQIGTVFVSYTKRDYVTIPNMLAKEGYYTFSTHGNKAAMWNRDRMYPTIGYQDFYAEPYFNYTDDQVVGLGISDHEFFKQVTTLLENIENEHDKYMGTVISLSNHSPFADLEHYGEFDLSQTVQRKNENGVIETVVDPYLNEGHSLGNYLKSVHYADQCLGEFLEYIKSSDAFDNTVFVFYGDHDAKLSKSEYDFYYNYDLTTGKKKEPGDEGYVDFDYYEQELNRKVPLMIWTKDAKTQRKLTKQIDYPMGMYDILPTIGNMMGFSSRYALGHDIFDIKNNNIVIFPNGNFLTDKVYYNNSKDEYKPLKEGVILESDYIEKYKKYTEERLEVSNNLIIHDLIAKEGNKTRNEGANK